MSRGPYPAPWAALRLAVLPRAGEACECRGAWGSTHHGDGCNRCGAPHHGWVVREAHAPERWRPVERPPSPRTHGAVRIILTTAHLCQDSTCEDLTPLRAYCQRCPRRYDRQHHVRNAVRTRRARLEQAGQLLLWELVT
jgi:hypothetical protein